MGPFESDQGHQVVESLLRSIRKKLIGFADYRSRNFPVASVAARAH